MSTKNQQTAQFNQSGMDTYNSLQSGFGNSVNSYMNNPFSNPFFQTQQQMGYKQADMQNQSNMSNITRNLGMNGMASNSPAAMEMMNNQMRSGTNQRANLGFLNPVNNAFTAQQNAMGMAGSYKPLQTGQTQTQSGLGTWLPQVAGMGISALTGAFGIPGGAAGGAMHGTMGAMNAAMSPMQSPFFSPGGNMPVNGSYGLGMNAPDVGGYNFGSNPFMR